MKFIDGDGFTAKDEAAPDITSEDKKALNTTLNILGFADNTEKKLREKLTRKGYSPDSVEYAVAYVKKIGALNDKRFLEREATRIAEQKLYGRRRIEQELYAKGFARDDILSLDFEEVDFPALCAKRIVKTRARFTDPRKLYAALVRYGYTSSDIREAQSLVREMDEDE